MMTSASMTRGKLRKIRGDSGDEGDEGGTAAREFRFF